MSDTAIVNYHVRSTETQAFQFDVDGIIGNLLPPELAPTEVRVRDVRDGDDAPDFDSDSIVFRRYTTSVQDFTTSDAWRATYDAELVSLLGESIGASEVLVFDHTVRVDTPDAARKPARNVHTDYSRFGAERRLIDLVGEDRAKEVEAGHYAFVNVWRPIEHPITSSPLGFIRPGSMAETDWMTIKLVYPDRVGEILGVAANKDHDWFYMSRMTPDEVAIFNIYDNSGRPFLGHGALDMARPLDAAAAPRKSIESRTLVRYER